MRPYVKEFLDSYVKLFRGLDIDIDSLILFGSQAKGTATVRSDIDIAVVMKEHLSPLQRGILNMHKGILRWLSMILLVDFVSRV